MSTRTTLHEKYLSAVAEICKPQPLAYRWFEQVLEVALLWDHIVDGDPIDAVEAETALQAATLTWVHNVWYVQNAASLTPVLMNCLSAWKHGGRVKQYDPYTELPCTLAMLLHGPAGVHRWLPKLRTLVDQERWEDTRRDHLPFLIVGLPRSRTAWLAAFLTEGDVHCHHELVRQCRQPADYARRLLATKAPIVGDADPALPMYYPRVRAAVGPHRVVFVTREPAAAAAAHKKMLAEAGPDFEPLHDQWPQVEAAFEQMRAACPDTLTFRFEDLDNEDSVRQLAEYCTGLPFNRARWRMFDELRVTALPAKVVRNLQEAEQ